MSFPSTSAQAPSAGATGSRFTPRRSSEELAASAPLRTGLGFTKSRSFYLWSLFSCLTVLFCFWKIPLVTTHGMRTHMAPGEWFWYNQRFYQNSMKLHLGAILPCAALAVFQFIPTLRNKYRQFHRINGRIVLILLSIGNIGALGITRHAFGGTMATQTVSFTLTVMTSYGGWKAYSTIKRRQIAEHRRWSLRTMFWMGCIITGRVILKLLPLVSNRDTYYMVFQCDELEFTMNMRNSSSFAFARKYPACQGLITSPSSNAVPVQASFGSYEEVASALRLNFGASLWIALLIHAVGVEIYQPKRVSRTAE